VPLIDNLFFCYKFECDLFGKPDVGGNTLP